MNADALNLDAAEIFRTKLPYLAQRASTRLILRMLLGASLPLLRGVYGAGRAALWEQRWRMFWMACAETFGYEGGSQWLVAHYRLVRTS